MPNQIHVSLLIRTCAPAEIMPPKTKFDQSVFLSLGFC